MISVSYGEYERFPVFEAVFFVENVPASEPVESLHCGLRRIRANDPTFDMSAPVHEIEVVKFREIRAFFRQRFDDGPFGIVDKNDRSKIP